MNRRMDLKLRKITRTDLEVVHKIESITYPAPWSLNFFKFLYHTNTDLFLVVTFENKILGYIIGKVEYQKSKQYSTKTGHVMNVTVTLSNRKLGIGTTLMEELERRFVEKGVCVAYLEVRESNKLAQEFYSNRGYVIVDKIKKYYGKEDGFVMVKTLLDKCGDVR
jgi:ribosomal-protein-alanine N-acetyltransferase